jgi:hypothetical protein
VAQAANGSFVVVWDATSGASGYDVLGQRFDPTGSKVGGEFQVNTYTTGYQWRPDIAMDASGSFVVVWGDFAGQDGSGAGVFGQRFDGSGNALGGQFQVNTYTTGNQSYGAYFGPAVARGDLGEFVVLWDDDAARDGSDFAVFGQRFDASGNRLGSEFQANTYTTGPQLYSTVSMDAAGNFVTTWASYSGWQPLASSASASPPPGSGAARSSRSTHTTGVQLPSRSARRGGQPHLTWADTSQDGSGCGSFARVSAGSSRPPSLRIRRATV